MPERVTREGEISIDGELYKLGGNRRVNQFIVSTQPPTVPQGDIGDEGNPLASTILLDDFRDGIGVNIAELPEDINRVWWSTAQLRYKGNLILPRLATTTAATATLNAIGILADFKNEVFATFSTNVHVYDNSSDSWGSAVRTIAAAATDAASGLIGGVDTLVVANGTDLDFATDSTTWAQNTGEATKFVVFWHDLLWGITQAGQLSYTDDLTAGWTQDAQLQLADDTVTGLLIARGADREEHIYAATKVGLFIHDDVNARFVPTDLQLPFHPDSGKGATVFRGDIYFPAGNSIYRFQAGSDQTIVTVMGPDRDDGLPSDRRGSIIQLRTSHNDLLAALSAASGAGISRIGTRMSVGVGSSRQGTFSSKTGFSGIIGWDVRGWEVKWSSGSSSRAINAILVSNAYNTYRMWWASNQRVFFMTLPIDVVNPLQVPTTTYDTTFQHETSWYDFGTQENKLALSVLSDSTHPSSSATLLIEFAIDLVESYTSVGTLTTTTTGEDDEFFLPSSSDVVGVLFRYIKFRVTGMRDSTPTATPNLHKLILQYRKRFKLLWGIQCVIDVSEEYGGKTVDQQIAQLKNDAIPDTLKEITWRNDTGGAENYFMDIISLTSSEDTGPDKQGDFQLQAAEPRQSQTRTAS